ncbi:MAG TPA: hypothetical protein DCK76_11240 [Desulfotomaculum sp.]|nr:hypothetical protein [Desulfotomaculum sp.]HBY04350.1 hypothetical protein [Desulfotomaculum sp.]
MENILDVFQVGASGPRPGHLHIVNYENLIWSCPSLPGWALISSRAAGARTLFCWTVNAGGLMPG